MDHRGDAGIDQAQDKRAAAEARRREYHRELKPVGVLQAMLVDQVARAGERLQRAAEWEEAVEPGDPKWVRYQGQAERSLYRALAELRRLVKAEGKARKAGAESGVREARVFAGLEVTAGSVVERRPSPQPSPGIPGEGAKPGSGGEGLVHWRPVVEHVYPVEVPQPPRISSMLSGAGAYSSGSML